jgi:Uma2 family endonuclease
MTDLKLIDVADFAPWCVGFPRLTAGEMEQMGEFSQGLELLEGVLVEMPPAGGGHGSIASVIDRILGNFVWQHKLGVVLAAETGFVVARNPDTVLAPDVAFVRAERVPPRESAEYAGFWHLAPDLVVEVASPGQTRDALAAKARRWLEAGTRLVWIIWPADRQIDVWRTGQDAPATLGVDDTLEGFDVVAGFTAPVADVVA